MSAKMIAKVVGKVFAYRDGALLTVIRGKGASPYGLALAPVRCLLVEHCHTLGYRGRNGDGDEEPEWARGAEISIYKIWAVCPPYEHECVVEVSYVAS
jgi:hypothetical protein